MGSLFSFRQRRKLLIAAAIVLAAAGAGFYARSQLADPVSGRIDFDVKLPGTAAMAEGDAWSPGAVDGAGFAEAARNAGYALGVQPSTGQIRVEDLRSGALWTSNPDKAALAKETVSGDLRTNLESPFVMEYYEQASIQRKVINSRGAGVKWTIAALKDGVAVRYDLTQLGIRFVMTYELTANGLRVAIPDAGIEENGDHRIISIEALPFFGAAAADDLDGYLFVPDGTGALMHFARGEKLIGKGYNQPVYGAELTNKSAEFDTTLPSTVPVFGMKKGDDAFLAIIQGGTSNATIRAIPAGVVSSFHSIDAKFVYREEYDRRLSLGGKSLRVFGDERSRQDGEVAYSFLSGKDANYVGMAKRYREELTAEGKLRPLPPQGEAPLELTIICGDANKLDHDYEAATTFGQAEDIVNDLKRSGVAHARITLKGWQKGGGLHGSEPFKVEQALGGREGLQAFVKTAHSLGYEVVLNANLVDADTDTDALTPKSLGIRSAEGDVLLGEDGSFLLTPNVTYNLAEKLVRQAKAIGIDGIQYDRLGDTVFRDYNPSYKYTREDTAYIYDRILDLTCDELGYGGVFLGNSYAFGHADHIYQMPDDGNHFYSVDEMVPFVPIALHGSMTYSMAPGNLRNDAGQERLKAIEYGAVPAFELTADTSRMLMDTKTYGIYSSRYAQWKKQVLAEYADMTRLSATAGQPIANHYSSGDGVYVTEYGNGVRVTVDYNDGKFDVQEEGSR
ncbi:DUF5696 domain-containing protein [Paenibacillus sacheonensis]|uniref:Uncharacterized protein n=1 Tax=Paenibacillus sacheonensis TaxID=742054 RepID=A0A7X5BYR5_9BACL|nr:DUF5696 domain-containing protein [Paenibacillus sacheonensis]MBM7564237.1 hypothetical protein [Paenibacillus sacheonensis]NBC67440.1 hypothetical protein [Paenibacillus sacheonensis]